MSRIRPISDLHRTLAIGLFALALFVRALLPAGWMPSALPGQVIALCTADGIDNVWMDAAGKVHKEQAPEPHQAGHPCAFAGIALSANLTGPVGDLLPPAIAIDLVLQGAEKVTIGRGLAAPPPPATGPPALI